VLCLSFAHASQTLPLASKVALEGLQYVQFSLNLRLFDFRVRLPLAAEFFIFFKVSLVLGATLPRGNYLTWSPRIADVWSFEA
jgi:hypothetical protein